MHKTVKNQHLYTNITLTLSMPSISEKMTQRSLKVMLTLLLKLILLTLPKRTLSKMKGNNTSNGNERMFFF